MKLLFLLFLLCFASAATPLQLTKQEKQYIQNNPIVEIGMMNDFSVFSYLKDTKVIGLEHDLLNIISSQTGLQFKKRFNTWPLIYKDFKYKKIDMIASISLNKYRKKFTLFTTSYYDMHIMLFKRDDFGSYNGLESLKEKKLGLISNIFYKAKLQKIDHLNLVYYSNSQEMVRDLVYGNIDAFILNYPTVSKIMEENNYPNIIESNAFPLKQIVKEDLRFGIKSENIILHSIIQKALDSISKESYRKLTDKWLLYNYTKPVNYAKIFLVIMFCIIVIGVILYILMKKRNKELSQLVITDKLTNLYNRRKLEDLIKDEIHRCERFERTFTLTILDIDYFKNVNDTYGHLVGDKVLIEIASILKNELRKTDFVGRLGGEEFIIICTESHVDKILPVIESLRLKIENYNFSEVGQKTASFGISMYKDDDTLDSIIKRADDALYQAKDKGRNRVVVNL